MMKRVMVISRVSLFPPEHGGAKNMRHIVESLTRQGSECRVLVKMQPSAPVRQRFAGQFEPDLSDYQPQNLNWNFLEVSYEGVPGSCSDLARRAESEIENFNPDGVLLCDDSLDPGSEIFEVAARSKRLVFLAQTIHCLPFGPYSIMPSEKITGALKSARRVVAPSTFVKNYIESHLQISASVYYPPVFGPGPFPYLGRRENPYITLINPCPWKGSSIFLKLAKFRSDLDFAVVPTWGADDALLRELRALDNVTFLPETPQIDEIFAQTRILLAPSLCQEAFGLVSPEALLRGVPVIASDLAGLKESTLGVASLIPVNPLFGGSTQPENAHENPIEPWSRAIDELLSSPQFYNEVSRRGKRAAEHFVVQASHQKLDLEINSTSSR